MTRSNDASTTTADAKPQGSSAYRRLRHHLSKTWLRKPIVWMRHRDLRASDVALASYPRSGSTWMRFMLYELLTGTMPQFGEIDHPASPTGNIGNQATNPGLLPGRGRLIKTHHLFRPCYRRAISLIRDPRDVAVSEYRYLKWKKFTSRDFDGFLKAFTTNGASGYGSWGDNIRSWLDAGLPEDVHLILRYEDLRAQPVEQLTEIAGFLGLSTDSTRIATIVEHNSLRNMKAREDRVSDSVYAGTRKDLRFVNEGTVRGWRKHLSPQQAEQIVRAWPDEMAQLGYADDA